MIGSLCPCVLIYKRGEGAPGRMELEERGQQRGGAADGGGGGGGRSEGERERGGGERMANQLLVSS